MIQAKALVGTPMPVPAVATQAVIPITVSTAQPVAQIAPVRTTTVEIPVPTWAPPTPTSVDSFSLRDYENGLWLRQGHPRLASSITELEWVRDGVNDTESKAIQDLLYIAVVSLPVASSIVALAWVDRTASTTWRPPRSIG